MPTAYRVEQAKSGRAVCRNTECKVQGVKIEKDDLRFGTLVEIKEVQSWHWKHWGCVTPLQLDKWWNELAEHNLDMIDGYDDLPPDLQAKVKRALEQGHVDDEDWKGDIERNRPGQKGFRTPKGKKSKAQANGAEIVEDPGTPSKPPTKKRGRPSKKEADDDDDEDEEQAPSKKAKKSSKAKTKSEEAAPAPGNDSAPGKKRGRPKKTAAADANDTKPTEKKEKRGRPKKAQNADVPAVEEPAKKRGRPKKAPADKGEDASTAPAKKRGRPKKAAAANVEAS